MGRRPPAPSECAQCGASIPPTARACPECGADERTGWREVSPYDGLDLPDEAWRESDVGAGRSRPPVRRVNGVPWYWWCVGVALVVIIGLLLAGLR